MSRHTDSTAYCRRQAADCGRKALEATLAEIREAYVNLEQGWLRLAPDTSDSLEPPVGDGAGRRTASASRRARNRSGN